MSKETEDNEVVSKKAIFEVMEHNDRQAELHRMAYAKEEFNRAISSCIEVVKEYQVEPFQPITTEMISKLKALKR